jgi:hypothetical protein
MNQGELERPEVGRVTWHDAEVAEVSLLLPGWQAALLQSLAASRRATVGQLLRGVITEMLGEQTAVNKSVNFERFAR